MSEPVDKKRKKHKKKHKRLEHKNQSSEEEHSIPISPPPTKDIQDRDLAKSADEKKRKKDKKKAQKTET